MTTTVFRIAPSGGDYTSFTEFQADRGVGIPTSPASGETWLIEVESGLADNSCNITQPNANSYIHIIAASGFEHNGDQNSTTAANLSLGTINFRITFENIIINSISRARFTSRYKQCIFLSANRLDGGTFESCFFPARGQTRLITIQFSEGTYFKNCTMEGFSDCAIVDQRIFTVGLTFENCAFIGCNEVYRDNRDLVTYPSVPDAVFDNCATDLAPIGTNHVSITAADFVDTANDNFIPAIGGALEKSGIHLGSETEVSKDVARKSRVYWDIGAYAADSSITSGSVKATLTIPSSQVSEAHTDFPVYIDASHTPSGFWNRFQQQEYHFNFSGNSLPDGLSATSATVQNGYVTNIVRMMVDNYNEPDGIAEYDFWSSSTGWIHEFLLYYLDSNNYALWRVGSGMQLKEAVDGVLYYTYYSNNSYEVNKWNKFKIVAQSGQVTIFINGDQKYSAALYYPERLTFGNSWGVNGGSINHRIASLTVKPLGAEGGSIRVFDSLGVECPREIVSFKPGGFRLTGEDQTCLLTLDSTASLTAGDKLFIEASEWQNWRQTSISSFLIDGGSPRSFIRDSYGIQFNGYTNLVWDGNSISSGFDPNHNRRAILEAEVSTATGFSRIGGDIFNIRVAKIVLHRVWVTDSIGNLKYDFNFDRVTNGNTVFDYVGAITATTATLPQHDIHWNNGTGELYFKPNGLSNITDNIFTLYADGITPDYDFSETFGRNKVWQDKAIHAHFKEDLTDSSGKSTLTEIGTTSSIFDNGRVSLPDGNSLRTELADYVNFVPTGGGYKVSFWADFPSPNSTDVWMFIVAQDDQRRFGIQRENSTQDLWVNASSNAAAGEFPLALDSMFGQGFQKYDFVVRDNFTAEFYVNGVLEQSITTTQNPNSPVANEVDFFGRPDFNRDFWVDALDELGFDNEPRSSNWVLDEYNNRASPETFYQFTTIVNATTIPAGENKETFYYSPRGWFKAEKVHYNTPSGWFTIG